MPAFLVRQITKERNYLLSIWHSAFRSLELRRQRCPDDSVHEPLDCPLSDAGDEWTTGIGIPRPPADVLLNIISLKLIAPWCDFAEFRL
jgi:hypothetical protein